MLKVASGTGAMPSGLSNVSRSSYPPPGTSSGTRVATVVVTSSPRSQTRLSGS